MFKNIAGNRSLDYNPLMKISYKILFTLTCITLAACCWSNTKQKQADIQVTIRGIEGQALKNATDRVNIKKKSIYAHQPTIVKWRFYQNLPEDIEEALKPYGYFKAKVHTSLTRHDSRWNIKASVDPGKQLKFTTVAVNLQGEGRTDPKFIDYLNSLPVKAGSPFDSNQYEKIKENLQNLANKRGYFQAKFTKNKLIVNLKTYTSEIQINYHTGKRYRFGKLNFSPSVIDQSLLRRYLIFTPGSWYNSYLLEESRKNLANSNYFSQVTVTPELNKSDHYFTPINITLDSQNQVTYSMGAGYGTDTGIRGMIGSNIRWLNSSGHSMNFQARGSQNNDQIAVNYVIPGPNPAISSYNIGGGVMDIDQATGQAKNAQASVSYRTQWGEWRASTGLVYLIENYTLNDFPTDGDNTNTDANVLYPQFTLQRVYAKEHLINPDYGYNIVFTGAGGRNFNGDNFFSQLRLDVRTLYTLQKTHTRVLARGSLGYIVIDDLVNLPLSMQFYTGGAQSIRGYEFSSIGPGRELAVGSIELQQKIAGNFYLGGFIDAGNVADDVFNQTFNIGAGPALVYLSPVGAIELSFGKQISNDSNSWAIQFSMGALL